MRNRFLSINPKSADMEEECHKAEKSVCCKKRILQTRLSDLLSLTFPDFLCALFQAFKPRPAFF
jgi:hypothetical protein